MLNEQPRVDGRQYNELRPVKITPDFVIYPEGSVLIEMGHTRVLCAVTIEAGVPRWMETNGKPGGWITAEYAMLPRSTQKRTTRESAAGSRSQEIRRLVGRSLRAAVDLEKLGPYTITIDCDVLQADGGTRTASITGGYVALTIALKKMVQAGIIYPDVFKSPVAAVSVGLWNSHPILDLNYLEDSNADADMNIIMNSDGEFIEIQGTAEKTTYSRNTLNNLLDLAENGIRQLITMQNSVIHQYFSSQG